MESNSGFFSSLISNIVTPESYAVFCRSLFRCVHTWVCKTVQKTNQKYQPNMHVYAVSTGLLPRWQPAWPATAAATLICFWMTDDCVVFCSVSHLHLTLDCRPQRLTFIAFVLVFAALLKKTLNSLNNAELSQHHNISRTESKGTC